MINEIVIILTNIAADLVLIALGLIFAWIGIKLGNNAKLKNILEAKIELEDAVLKTVGKLKQEFVDNWKEANGGKLTEEQKAYLKNETLSITISTLSQPAIDLLEAAGVDFIEYVRNAAETWVGQLNHGEGVLLEEVTVGAEAEVEAEA